MLIRFCLCFGMGCTPSMLSENSRRNRKNSDIYTQSNISANNGKSPEIIQDSTKCNQILVNPYQGFNNKKDIVIAPESCVTSKKDSIISVTASGHIIGHIIPPTVRRATIASKYYDFFFYF